MHENQLVLDLCKFKQPDTGRIASAFSEPLDLPNILGQLLFHRIGGIAYYVFEQCGLLPKLNREFRNPLKMVYDASRERTNSFLQAEDMLAEIFADVPFPCAFLKGALLSKIYPVGLRTSNDFDILINQQDVQAITELLTKHGFTQGFLRNDVFTPATRSDILYARMNKGETVPFVKRIDLPHMPWLEVDVNFSLDFKAAQENDAVQRILSRTEKTIVTENGALQTLLRTDFLIHLCTHLYKEATTYFWVNAQRDLSLYKFVDIYLFLELYLDVQYADELALAINEYDLINECFYTLYYTRELFGLENALLDKLIEKITPEKLYALRLVFAPKEKKVYQFDIDYIDYLFHPNRLSCLTEV